MATNRQPPGSYLVGLVPPYPLTAWDAETNATAQDPQIGPAVPDSGVYSLGTLATSGTSTTGVTVETYIGAPGFPFRPTGGMAGFMWRRQGDSRYHGFDEPYVIAGFEPVSVVDGLTATHLSNAYPAVCKLADDSILCSFQTYATAPSTLYAVKVSKRSADGNTQGSLVTVYSQSATPVNGLQSCMVLLPSGRVLLFHGYEPSTSTFQVLCWYSDDSGATWTRNTRGGVLVNAIDTGASGFTVGRMRAAYANGQIVLFVEVRSKDTSKGASAMHDTIFQYASIDLGGSFEDVANGATIGFVTPYDTSIAGARPDVVAFNGGFVFTWLMWRSSGPDVQLRSVVLPSAFDSYRDLDRVTINVLSDVTRHGTVSVPGGGTSYQVDSGENALTVTDAGELWLYYHDDADGEGFAAYTRDAQTWSYALTTVVGSPLYARWWENGDASTYPRYFSAVGWRGCVLVLHQWAANPGDEDNSIAYIRLGGWSKLTWPFHVTTNMISREQGGFTLNYLPYDLPADVGWTSTGAATQTLTGGELKITTTGANLRWYEQTGLGASLSDGLLIRAWVKIESGGDKAANEITVSSRIDDGAAGYEFQARFSTTGFTIYDVNAAADVGSATFDATDGVELLVHFNEDGIVAAYRIADNDSGKDFTIAVTGTLNNASTGATERIRFGHPTNSSSVSYWREVHCSTQTGIGWVGNTSSPGDLRPAPMTTTEAPMYVEDGIHIAGVGGPFVTGETWTIAPVYDYPKADILYTAQPSRRRQFRSVTGSPPSSQVFAWQNDSGQTTARLNESSIALILSDCNWRTATLARYRGGAWSTLASIDLATGLTSMPFVRNGTSVTVDTGGSFTGPWYFHRNALVGATVDLGGGDLRKVTANTDGVWTTSGTVRRPILYLDGIDGTEATSGSMNLWMPGGAIVIHTASTDQEAAGYRLSITSQATADTDIRCKAHLGPIVTTAPGPDGQRRMERIGGFDEVSYPDGSRRRFSRSPAARRHTVSWADRTPNAQVGGSQPSPDYVLGTTAANARPLASHGARGGSIRGLIEEISEGADPVGVIHYIPIGSTSPSVHHILRPDLFIVGYIADPSYREEVAQHAQLNTAQEWEGEMTGVGEFVVEEVP